MRIAVITASFLPRVGGAEFAVHHLARQWRLQGHEVTVFNQLTGERVHPEADYDVVQYRNLPGMWRFGRHRFPYSKWAARTLRRILERYRPDFISAHFGYPLSIWLSRIRPVPRYLVTCHGPALDLRPGTVRRRYDIDDLLRDSLNRAAGVVAISSHARRVLVELGVEERRIVDIPNGVEVPRFGRPVEGFDLRTTFDLPRDAIVLLSVGRNAPEKAYGTALEAFARAAPDHPRLHWVLLGRGTSAWQLRARELGVDARIRFSEGLRGDDLIGAYQQSDIFLLASIKELCPLVVPEAMAAGLPEIVTDVSGSQDMVLHEQTGLIVPPGEVEPLAAAISRLAGDEALRRRFGAAGRDRSALYDWERLSRLYLGAIPDGS